MKEENLIFIVSQPRAGSTFLQNVLSNNPQTNTVSEPWVMLGLVPILRPKLIDATYDFKLAHDALLDYESKFNELDIKREIKKMALTLYKPMFNEYDFIIDKTPRYWEILDELVVLFPKSKIIILKRNPVDVVKSMIKTWNISTLDRLNYFRRDLLLAPKVMHNFIENHKGNKNVYSLTYEDLLQNSEFEFKKLYDWVGVEFDLSFLDSKSNQKYKGKYGDPYQNKIKDTLLNMKNSKKEISKVTKKFLEGYVNFLGEDFLKSFGSYSFKNNKTYIFDFYMDLGELHKTKSFRQDVLLKIKRRFIGKLLTP